MKVKIALINLLFITVNSYAQFGDITTTVNIYDNGKLITAGKGKYKVEVRNNSSNLFVVKPTEPAWQDVKSYKSIQFELRYQNPPYSLKVTDTVLGKTMIVHSQLNIDSLPFVAGEYSIPTSYVQLFNLKPDSTTKVIGADVRNFKVGTKQNYKKPEFAFKAVRANLFLAELPLAKKAGAFTEQKNEYWMFNDNGSFTHKALPADNYIYDIQEIDEKHYYMLVRVKGQFGCFNHIYISTSMGSRTIKK